MKRAKRWRYYCDYCKKSGGNSLAIHETHCTMNPDRICRMCEIGGEKQQPIKTALAALDGRTDLKLLRLAVHNCPACILAAIRQAEPNHDFSHIGRDEEFDYKKESQEWLTQCNTKKEDQY